VLAAVLAGQKLQEARRGDEERVQGVSRARQPEGAHAGQDPVADQARLLVAQVHVIPDRVVHADESMEAVLRSVEKTRPNLALRAMITTEPRERTREGRVDLERFGRNDPLSHRSFARSEDREDAPEASFRPIHRSTRVRDYIYIYI